MTLHHMKLAAEPFQKILAGTKIIESRLYDDKRRTIQVGDEIEFSENDHLENTVTVRVVALHLYPTFRELFAAFPLGYFGWESLEELLAVIRRFYSVEDEQKWGVVGIQIEKISK